MINEKHFAAWATSQNGQPSWYKTNLFPLEL